MLSIAEVRHNLTGPIPSIRTPFKRDGSIDYNGLRRIIDFTVEAGSNAVLLTLGDSLYTLLTDEEVAEVTRVAIEHTAKRAMVVVADKPWWTGKAVEFAQYAQKVGADVVMVTPPDWGASCTAQTYVDHYNAVSRHLPVMIVTAVFISRGMDLALETLKGVLDQVDQVVAIKDDFCGEFGRKMSRLVHNQWAVIAGGMKQNHLDLLPYGCDGYLSTFMAFKPEIAREYWKAIQSKDMTRACAIIHDYDFPYFDYISSLAGNFDAGIHGCLELYGLAGRWRRTPYYTLSDKEMDQLKKFLSEKRLFAIQ